MSQHNLNRIFNPRHVAVVGASEKVGTIGSALMKNLIDGGFTGTVLPATPKYKTINGQPCFASVSALETGVDLAIIATPIQSVVGIVSECVENKIGGAVIISAGARRSVKRPPPLTRVQWQEKMPYMMPLSSAPASSG